MTIFNIAKLPFATYNGVEFAYQDSNVTGGRKTVTHEYPNADNRYVEDLGLLEKKFSVSAWTDDNVDYSVRDSLIEELDRSGIGTLIHPRYGEQNVVVVGYTINDNIRQLGISQFNIEFEVASLNTLPDQQAGNKGFLSNLKDNILGENKEVFDNAWKAVINSKDAFDSANRTLKQVGRRIRRASQVAQGSVDTFGDFTTSINEIINSSASLIQTPSVLSTKLQTSFNNLSVGYNNSQDLFDVCRDMFGFDEKDQDVIGNSSTSNDIRNNQDQLNNFVNASVLALAYNAAANINYSTLSNLNQAISDLENGYQSLPNLNRNVRKLIIDARVEANKIFSQLAISLPRVIEYEIKNPTTLNVLVYSLYGSLELKNQIRDLNQFIDTSDIRGRIKILSNV